jgi:hypothetical protein
MTVVGGIMKKKKFLIITGVIVLSMALGGFWGYNHYFAPDQEVQKQLNSQFGEDFFNSFEDKVVKNSGTVNNSEGINNAVKPTDNPIPDSVLTPPSLAVPDTNVAKQITQDDINNKYQPQFSYLQGVALSRLDALYSAAVQEYVQSSKAGTLKRPELVQKYFQAGNMLEASLDKQFYSTTNSMEAELIANHLPTDIVGVYKTEYENAKSAKRSQLLAKVLK